MIHWSKNKTHLVVYHGTHIKNVPGIIDLNGPGISNKDPKTGMVSVAIGSHGADVAHGYAAMSGEHGFRQAGSRAVTVPPQHRAIITAHIPMDWVRRNVDQNFGGNPDRVKRRLSSSNIHNIHVAATGSDFSPSETPELRFKEAIPAKYIVGVSQKAKKMKTFKEFSEEVAGGVPANSVSAQAPSAIAKPDGLLLLRKNGKRKKINDSNQGLDRDPGQSETERMGEYFRTRRQRQMRGAGEGE